MIAKILTGLFIIIIIILIILTIKKLYFDENTYTQQISLMKN